MMQELRPGAGQDQRRGDAAMDVSRQQERLARRHGGEHHRGDAGRRAHAEVERGGRAEQLRGQLLGFLHAVRGVQRVVGRRHRRQVIGERRRSPKFDELRRREPPALVPRRVERVDAARKVLRERLEDWRSGLIACGVAGFEIHLIVRRNLPRNVSRHRPDAECARRRGAAAGHGIGTMPANQNEKSGWGGLEAGPSHFGFTTILRDD